MSARLTIVGLGKLGLPLSVYYAMHGATVRGVDRSEARVRSINERTTIDLDNEEGLRKALDGLKPGQFTATTDTVEAVRQSDTVVLVVPVIARARGQVDYSAMESACDAIAQGLQPGTTVIFETTLPIGTTRNRLLPRLAKSGLTPGKDLFVAFSPERVLVSRIFTDLEKYPKIVGGTDPESGRRAAAFYKEHLNAPVWEMKDAETAEFVKLAETCFRTTNIGLANELAKSADAKGIDIYEVIRGANSQPYSNILEPGIGVGGHCLPVYPFLLEESGLDVPLIERGRAINASMGQYGVDRLEKALGSVKGKTVLILGVAFRPGVQESAFSPAFDVRDALVQRGATVLAVDPLFTDAELTA
ncbi:MAG: nucleotide sugar dehydrogenase, partial [Candidatus Eremiobacteraeota bacterium]|nr:nucleotide sugar dehydrogenase [Candidatus Eremiobacteraeota bacterium]